VGVATAAAEAGEFGIEEGGESFEEEPDFSFSFCIASDRGERGAGKSAIAKPDGDFFIDGGFSPDSSSSSSKLSGMRGVRLVLLGESP